MSVCVSVYASDAEKTNGFRAIQNIFTSNLDDYVVFVRLYESMCSCCVNVIVCGGPG